MVAPVRQEAKRLAAGNARSHPRSRPPPAALKSVALRSPLVTGLMPNQFEVRHTIRSRIVMQT